MWLMQQVKQTQKIYSITQQYKTNMRNLQIETSGTKGNYQL